MCTYAAQEGYLGLLVWADSIGCKVSSATFRVACSNGHLEVLRYLFTAHPPERKNHQGMFGTAMKHGHIHILDYILGMSRLSEMQLGLLRSYETRLHLQYSREKIKTGICFTIAGYGDATAGGHLHVIVFLRDRGLMDYQKAVLCAGIAARHGHSAILEYVWNEFSLAEKTVERGHHKMRQVDILCEEAVTGNQMDILRWLVGKGANVPGTNVCAYACRVGSVDIIKYVCETFRGSLTESVLVGMYMEAFNNGHSALCQWLNAAFPDVLAEVTA